MHAFNVRLQNQKHLLNNNSLSLVQANQGSLGYYVLLAVKIVSTRV